MKTTSEQQEHGALNEWLAEHVMQFERGPAPSFWLVPHGREFVSTLFRPTTDPAAALAVLEKIADMMGHTPHFTKTGNSWTWQNYGKYETDATLPLAICRFAKAIYSV